jgi:hypothetical protein
MRDSDVLTAVEAGSAREAGMRDAHVEPNGDVSQLPPQGAAAIEAWIAQGDYKRWHCESAPHAGRSPSVYGINRICSNDVISANAASTAPWPIGAAAVKEVFNAETDREPAGYSVYAKLADDGANQGSGWYWYERFPTGALGSFVVADGMGVGLCVSCHGMAGQDAANTPSEGARDLVFTAVP